MSVDKKKLTIGTTYVQGDELHVVIGIERVSHVLQQNFVITVLVVNRSGIDPTCRRIALARLSDFVNSVDWRLTHQ